MRNLSWLALVVGALVALGCQRQNEELEKRLDRLEGKIDTLTQKIESMPARPGPAAGQMPQRPPGPDPTAVYAVDVSGDPCKGPSNAKVTIVKAAEFACPFCQRVGPTLDELMKQYPNDIRVCWKHYIVHPQTATTPALAACAAQQQGKFWEMTQAIFDKAFGKDLSEAKMLELATELKLDINRFKADLASDKCKQDLENDQRSLAQVGVRGTPAFYINGRFLSGAQPIDNFKRIIDEELKKADAAIKGGVKAEEYYQKEILAKGMKSL